MTFLRSPILVLVLGIVSGCHRSASESPQAAPSAAAVPARPPLDHLAKGEVIEGTESALGFPLPRSFVVRARFPDLVLADGPLPPARVEEYVKARLKVEPTKIRSSPGSLRLEDGTLPQKPDRRLTIVVEPSRDGSGTSLHIRDTTPPSRPPMKTDEERYRAAGLTPDGKPLNPHALD